MRSDAYDVVVIGSGFGGAIAANRLALAGKRVLVLERGPWRDSVPVRSMGIQQRAVDVFTTLFGRAIAETDGMVFGLATGESLACLNFWVQAGQAHKTRDANGVDWYQAVEGCISMAMP